MTGIVRLVATILGLGVAAPVIADRLTIPSVLFLIRTGIGVSPEGLGIVGLEAVGGAESLEAIVRLSDAISIFEAAFHLDRSRLRQTPRDGYRLVTRRTEAAAPIAVYYRLTEKSATLLSRLDDISQWAVEWMNEVDDSDEFTRRLRQQHRSNADSSPAPTARLVRTRALSGGLV